MDVGIVGGSGYGGAELLRLLAGHPAAKVRAVAAGSAAGRRLDEVFPNLAGLPAAGEPLTPADPDAMAGCDVVFLATPHAASMALAPPLLDAGTVVVDLSGAFRLDAGAFADWYGLTHTAEDLTPAPYGLPELFRDDLAGARLVAGPGCYPTAALLALAPLAGLVDPATVVVTGLSGTSGAGKGLREDLHASHVMGNVAPYGAPRHRHTPEIERRWADLAGLDDPPPVTFVPHLVPMPRGMVTTVTATLTDGAASQVAARIRDRYEAEPFVTVLAEGRWPASAHTLGGNAAHVGFGVDPRAGRVTVACALDNLVKGAAGQAVQAANAVLGLPEPTGLPLTGTYP